MLPRITVEHNGVNNSYRVNFSHIDCLAFGHIASQVVLSIPGLKAGILRWKIGPHIFILIK
ncbi:hypothetical protein TUM19329_20460 [Legionella antarctica]|uniref:Uncharacterized protein n=1 Tax=Legionella antarctica TaxID=2708020 RepID=A0A6F8T4S0_9GAMM|nr:hypothetical protein TUM19329_20460 [Legionella antarctica]